MISNGMLRPILVSCLLHGFVLGLVVIREMGVSEVEGFGNLRPSPVLIGINPVSITVVGQERVQAPPVRDKSKLRSSIPVLTSNPASTSVQPEPPKAGNEDAGGADIGEQSQSSIGGQDLKAAEVRVDIHPIYPRRSRALGEEGDVLVRLRLSQEGELLEAELLKSSGHWRLDEAALLAIRGGKFQLKNRLSGEILKNLNVVFKLNN